MKWGLFVPTYKRKEPLILRMLQLDKSITLNLCVRHEELVKGFYDHLLNTERVNIIDLGSGLTELGETRQRILQYCIDNEYDYCAMFDDCISNCGHKFFDSSITATLRHCIDLMQEDELKEYVVGFSFVKRFTLNDKYQVIDNKSEYSNDTYFLSFPGQAVLLDVNQLVKHNICYHDMNDVGFEDAALFGDTVKAGLVWCSRNYIYIDGMQPNVVKQGGSHKENEDNELKYDILNLRSYKYLNMMGTHITKRYRKGLHCMMSFLMYDYDFFRKVLCEDRELNAQIIKNRFELGVKL